MTIQSFVRLTFTDNKGESSEKVEPQDCLIWEFIRALRFNTLSFDLTTLSFGRIGSFNKFSDTHQAARNLDIDSWWKIWRSELLRLICLFGGNFQKLQSRAYLHSSAHGGRILLKIVDCALEILLLLLLFILPSNCIIISDWVLKVLLLLFILPANFIEYCLLCPR